MGQDKIVSNSIQAFSIAAVIFGLLTVMSFFTGVIPLFTGSLSLLFVALSHRKGMPLTGPSHLAVYLSVTGMILGIALIMYSYYAVLLPMMNDPEYYKAMDLYYRNNFGIGLDELLGMSLQPASSAIISALP